MLLMTSNTRSGGVGQGRASSARRVSGRSAAQSLDGRRSGGYLGHERSRAVFFNTFSHSNRYVYAPEPRTHRFVSNCLIPQAFTHSNL